MLTCQQHVLTRTRTLAAPAGLEAFRRLPQPVCERLARTATYVHAPAGSLLFEEDAAGEQLQCGCLVMHAYMHAAQPPAGSNRAGLAWPELPPQTPPPPPRGESCRGHAATTTQGPTPHANTPRPLPPLQATACTS